MPISADRRRFDALRTRYLAADAKLREAIVVFERRYGSVVVWRPWLSAAESARLQRLDAAKDRASRAIYALLEAISPRSWMSGVSAHWVCAELSWEDAVRPLSEPLSVTPPLAYGATEPLA